MSNTVISAPLRLRKNSVLILREARARGVITQQEVLNIIPIAVLRDREALLRTLYALTDFFTAIDVIIVREQKTDTKERPETKLRKNARKEGIRNSLKGRDQEADFSSLALYAREVKHYPLLSREEEIALSNQIQQNQDREARNKLVKHNLRLCLKLVWRYAGRGLNFADLIQEGNLGLIRAAELFRAGEHTTFSTYAWFWIEQKMDRAVREQRDDVRIPIHRHEMLNKIWHARDKIFREFGREATEEEIASLLDCSVDTVRRNIACAVKVLMYDAPRGDESDGTYWDVIPDGSSLNPEQIFEAKEELKEADVRLQKLMKLAASLSVREEAMFRLYYGLSSIKRMTLEEVGKKYNVTRERVRQILAKIWEKLYQLGLPKQYTDDWLIGELQRIVELEKIAGIPAHIFGKPPG